MKHFSAFSLFIFIARIAFSQNPVNTSYEGYPDGEITTHFLNGKVKMHCTIQNGKLQGDRSLYFRNGKLSVNEQFDKGKFNGSNCLLTRNGDTSYVERYRHDTLTLTILFQYYKSRKIKVINTNCYKNDSSYTVDFTNIKPFLKYNNVETDKEYYESGALKSYSEQTNSKNNGKYIEYYENGQQKTVMNYINGMENGTYEEYYPSGQLKVKGTLKDNRFIGEYSAYDENGTPKKK